MLQQLFPKNVMLVDDHAVLRDALAAEIHKHTEITITQVAANGEEMIAHILQGHVPDAIVLDLNMPVMDGFQAAEWLKEKHPGIRVLVLTMYESEMPLIRLLKTGVRGFLRKDVNPVEFRTALLSVLENGYYYSHSTTGKLASLFTRFGDGTSSSLQKVILSDIEIKFLQHAASDMTYKEIAYRMKMTPRAIDGYRDNLFEKLEVKSRVGLAIYALRNGIVAF